MYKHWQLFRCKQCFKYQRKTYIYKKTLDSGNIALLNNEGVSVSSISWITSIPKTAVLRKLQAISNETSQPIYTKTGQDYEIDELRTYVGNKSN